MMGLVAALTLGFSLQADGDPVAIAQVWLAQPTAIENPGLERIIDDAGWKQFWKRHTPSSAAAAPLNFRQQMALVLPAQVPADEETVMAKSGVNARLTDAALVLSLTLTLKPAVATSRTLLTVLALPRSSRPVDFQIRLGKEPGGYASAGTLDGLPGAETLRGILTWSTVEGGAWILVRDQKSYDLHGNLQGFKSGDRVEVFGHVPTGSKCVHMVGTLFDVESIRAWKEK